MSVVSGSARPASTLAAAVLLSALLPALAGCGQKGPLTLPQASASPAPAAGAASGAAR